MYEQLAGKLRKAHPSARSLTVLEDNDPAGLKAKKGIAAKVKGHIHPINFPMRTPDLNPLDYGFWAEVNRRMRRQERSWRKSKIESRQDCHSKLTPRGSALSVYPRDRLGPQVARLPSERQAL